MDSPTLLGSCFRPINLRALYQVVLAAVIDTKSVTVPTEMWSRQSGLIGHCGTGSRGKLHPAFSQHDLASQPGYSPYIYPTFCPGIPHQPCFPAMPPLHAPRQVYDMYITHPSPRSPTPVQISILPCPNSTL